MVSAAAAPACILQLAFNWSMHFVLLTTYIFVLLHCVDLLLGPSMLHNSEFARPQEALEVLHVQTRFLESDSNTNWNKHDMHFRYIKKLCMIHFSFKPPREVNRHEAEHLASSMTGPSPTPTCFTVILLFICLWLVLAIFNLCFCTIRCVLMWFVVMLCLFWFLIVCLRRLHTRLGILHRRWRGPRQLLHALLLSYYCLFACVLCLRFLIYVPVLFMFLYYSLCVDAVCN